MNVKCARLISSLDPALSERKHCLAIESSPSQTWTNFEQLSIRRPTQLLSVRLVAKMSSTRAEPGQSANHRLANINLLDLPSEILARIVDEALADAIETVHDFRSSVTWQFCQRQFGFGFQHVDIVGPSTTSTTIGTLTIQELSLAMTLQTKFDPTRAAKEFAACDTVLATLEDIPSASPMLAVAMEARAQVHGVDMLVKCRTVRANLQRAKQWFIGSGHWKEH